MKKKYSVEEVILEGRDFKNIRYGEQGDYRTRVDFKDGSFFMLYFSWLAFVSTIFISGGVVFLINLGG